MQVVQTILITAVGKALVQDQTFMDVAAITVRQQGWRMQVDFGSDAQGLIHVRLQAFFQRSDRSRIHN